MVVVLVDVDVTGELALQRLREIELHAHATAAQHHAADHAGGGSVRGGVGTADIGAGVVAVRTRRVGLRRTVGDIARRLSLGDGVAGGVGRRQVDELVFTVIIGLDRDRNRVAIQVGTGQGHVDIGNAGVAAIHVAVVVVIAEHKAAETRVTHLGGGRLLVVVRIQIHRGRFVICIATRLNGSLVGVNGRHIAAREHARHGPDPQRQCQCVCSA
ncbi:hypothetical protein D3C81_1386660 [compost metagenome]